MKKWIGRIGKTTWKTKLLLCLLGIGVIPAILICVVNYGVASNILMDQSIQNTHYLLEQDVSIINTMFSNYERVVDNIIMDDELSALFAQKGLKTDSELMRVDSRINHIIGRYFSLDTIHSYAFYTPSFGFGSNNIPILNARFEKTELYQSAVEAAGRTVWLPTYEFAKVFDLPNLNDTSADYKNLFCMVKQVNFGWEDISNSGGWQAPVLVINFRDSMLTELLSKYGDMGGEYAIYTPGGEIVYFTAGMREDLFAAQEIWPQRTFVSSGGQKIICTSSLSVNSWRVSVALPAGAILQELSLFQKLTIITTVLLFLLAVFLSALLRKSLMRPLNNLADGFQTSGKGDFSNRLTVASHDEFGVLAQQYNEMNEKISKLISENYLQKISNQQAEIVALSFQLNPHFLYNCLNLINLMVLTGNSANGSKMIVALSQIMRYTAKTYDELVSFSEDYTWLMQYMSLVHYLNEGVVITADFDPEIMDKKVPKLLLQPFIENSIVHGFQNSAKGTISICGRYDSEKELLTFVISDDGTGLSQEECDSIMQADSGCVHNVLRRIRLIYGESSSIRMVGETGGGVVTTLSFPAKRLSP